MRGTILLAGSLLLVAAAFAVAQSPELPAEIPVPEPAPVSPPPEGLDDDDQEAGQDTHVPPPESSPEVPLTSPAAQSPPKPDLGCEAALTALGVRYARLEPIADSDGCGVGVPYNITEVAPGVTLEPDTEMTCEAGLSLARWVKGTVIPAAETLGEGVTLATVTHASTYVCRRRNSQAGSRISVHAIGGAIDIASFSFRNHEAIPVLPRAGDGTRAEAFQRAVRAGACLYFTTVLGPGSDAYHDNHLHLDVMERPRGFRLCQ
jgi:hypothetical protein